MGGRDGLRGDVVTYNGVTYLAVNPSTGVTPAGGIAGPDIGIALPSRHGRTGVHAGRFTDGPDLFVEFRYVAAKATNKWVSSVAHPHQPP
jgi:hypothetical protein